MPDPEKKGTTQEEIDKIINNNKLLKDRISIAESNNYIQAHSTFKGIQELPKELIYAAVKGGWDLNNLPNDYNILMQRAYDEQVARGERLGLRWDNFLHNIGSGFNAAVDAIWEKDRTPQYQENNRPPVYHNPSKERMAIGSGYWGDQLEQLGLSIGIMGGMYTDPVTAGLTAVNFIPGTQEFGIPLLAARIGKYVKYVNNAGKYLRTSTKLTKLGKTFAVADAMRIAKGIKRTSDIMMKTGLGVRGGYYNALINRGFVEDEAYTKAIDEGYSPEQAYMIAKEKGEKQFNLEKYVDMAFGAAEVFNIFKATKNLPNNVRRMLKMKPVATSGMFKNRWANFTTDILKSALIEGGQEVWEEIAAIYGESAGTKDEIKNAWDLISKKSSWEHILSQKERLIDNFIGGFMGGALLGLPFKTGVAIRENIEDKRININNANDSDRLQKLMRSTLVKPEKLKLELDKKKFEALEKIEKLKKENASIEDIAAAEKALNDIEIESQNLNKNTLLTIKRLSMELSETDPQKVTDYNTSFNASLIDKIKAIEIIENAQKTNPNIINDTIKNNDTDSEVYKAISTLKEYGIIDENNNVTDGNTLAEYKEMTQQIFNESIQMDLDYLDGFFKVSNNNSNMAYQYMVDNAEMRNIDRKIDSYKKMLGFEAFVDENASYEEKLKTAKKALEFLKRDIKDEDKKKKIDDVLENELYDIDGISDDDLEALDKFLNEKYDEIEKDKKTSSRAKKNIKNKRSEAYNKLINSNDWIIKEIAKAYGNDNEYISNTIKEALNIDALRSLNILKDINILEKQKKYISERIGEYKNRKNLAYHQAKTAYIGCLISISESGRNIDEQLADTIEAIMLCQNVKLKNNKEIQNYLNELFLRYMKLKKLSKTKSTDLNIDINVSENNTVDINDTTEKESNDTLSEVNDKIHENTCEIILESLSKNSNISINDWLNNIDSLTRSIIDKKQNKKDENNINDIKEKTNIEDKEEIQQTEEVAEKVTEENAEETKSEENSNNKRHEEEIKLIENIKANDNTIQEFETISKEEQAEIRDRINNINKERSIKMIDEIRQATSLFEKNDLIMELEKIADRYNVDISNVTSVAFEFQTTFDNINFVGCEKSSSYYNILLNKAFKEISDKGYDFEMLEKRIDIIYVIFKSKGFYDITFDDVYSEFNKIYKKPDTAIKNKNIKSEEKIQKSEKEKKIQKSEDTKKIGTDYDILQYTYIGKNQNGENIFMCGITDINGNPVMDEKCFARLRSLSAKSKKRIYIKGFYGSFDKNKIQFREYLHQIFNYKVHGNSFALDKFKKIFGYDINSVIYNDDKLKELWKVREQLFGMVNQPVYATDDNGNDPIVIGFIPTNDYYSKENCSIFTYKNGTKVLGTEQERAKNISVLNNGTRYINKEQMNGDVDFNAGLRDRVTSEINKSKEISSVNINIENVSNGIQSNNLETGIYMQITDSTSGVNINFPVLIHFPGNTYIDNDGNIRIFTAETSEKINLGEQNPEFFENFKNNLIDIVLKYAVNLIRVAPANERENICKDIISNNKSLLRVDDIEIASKRLYNYAINKKNKFDIANEIKKKLSCNTTDSFLVKENYIGGGLCGFNISYKNNVLEICLDTAESNNELKSKNCQYDNKNAAKGINSLLKYISDSFDKNGIANKAVVFIKDYRKSSAENGNNQFISKLYTDDVCGKNLEMLENDNFVPLKKDAKTVIDYMNEKCMTNISLVSLKREDGKPMKNADGTLQMSIFSGIIRTLKLKPKDIKKSIIPEHKENIYDIIISANSRISNIFKINRKGVIKGFNYIQQKELCKSLFAYIIANDRQIRNSIRHKKINVVKIVSAAKELIKNNKIDIFPRLYGLYDKIQGVSSRSNNKDYIEGYSFDISVLNEEKKNNVIKSYKLIESISDNENMEILFHFPKSKDNTLKIGAFTSYIASIINKNIGIDEYDFENDIDVTQNDSLDNHIKSDFEKDDITDFSSYLKCILSVVPKENKNNLAFATKLDLYEYEDIQTVISVITRIFTESQCDWEDFIYRLKNYAEDTSYKYNNICKNLYDIFISNDIDIQNKKEITSKLTKSFVDMMYAYHSKNNFISVNSESGMKKQSYETAKVISYCKNAKYFNHTNGHRTYNKDIFYCMIGEADDIATQIINDEDYDISSVKDIIRNIYGITISTKTIKSNKELVSKLLSYTYKLKDLVAKNDNITPFEYINRIENKPLSKLIEQECILNDESTDSTNMINGKLVMTTYFRTLREKLFNDINNGSGNIFFDALYEMYSFFDGKKNNYVFPQLEFIKEYPPKTGLVSLSALTSNGKKSDRINSLSSSEQAAIEAVFNSETVGTVSKRKFHIHGFKSDMEFEFSIRNGYIFADTVSDKQKLAWIRTPKIVIPVSEYISNNKNYIGVDYNKVYEFLTQQILDSELIRIERELDEETVMPNKTGRHLLLSIPELNTIEVNINGKKQDLESLLRQCYYDGTKEVFKAIRDDYDNIYSQAKNIVSKSIERSVANLICNENAKQKIKNGARIFNQDGSLALQFDDMENSLWEQATIMESSYVGERKFMQPKFLSSYYDRTVINSQRPNPALYSKEGMQISGSVMNADMTVAYAAFDQIVNRYLTNIMMYNCYYGPLNNMSKVKNYDSLKVFDAGNFAIYDDNNKRNEQNVALKNKVLSSICNTLGININKRMAGTDGSGKMLDFNGIIHENNQEWGGGVEHKNSIFKYLIVKETEKISPTYIDILELKYGKQNSSVHELVKEAETSEKARKELESRFPLVSSFLNIDTTDGAEYVTAREAVDWLLAKGDLNNDEYIKLQSLYERISGDLSSDDQNLIFDLVNKYNKVINPSKPMCYGVMMLGKDGKPCGKDNPAVTMHTFYGKSAMIPLLPNFTKGKKLDLVRIALERMEHENQMNCRLIFNSAVKLGSVDKSKMISFNRICEIGNDIVNGKHIEIDEMNASSVYMNRKFLCSQMETNSHREEISSKINENQEDLNYIDKIFANGQTKIVDSTQMDHILEGIGLNSIKEKIFKLPKRVCENFSSPDKYDIKENKKTGEKEYFVDGPEFEKIRFKFTKQRVNDEYNNLLSELGIKSDNEIDLSNPKFIRNLTKILGNELLSRGADINILHQMGIIENFDSSKNTFEFKIPLLLQTSSTKLQILLMSIIRQRICKNKLPGNPMYTASSEGFEKMQITSDKDESFNSKGVIWLYPDSKKILGSTLNEDGTLKCADIAIPSQFTTYNEEGKLVNLDFYKSDDNGKLVYLVGEKGQDLYVNKNGKIITEHEGIYLNRNKIDNALIDNMMSLRIPVSGHMSGAAVRVVAFLPDSMGDTIIVPAEHFKQLGEDLDIDKRFLYLKNYVVRKNGDVKVITENIIDELIDEFDDYIDEKLNEYIKTERKYIDFETREDVIKYFIDSEFKIDIDSIEDVIYDKDRVKEIIKNDYREKLFKKLRENENIDFYISVFTNPDKDIQNKIQRVLGFEDLIKTKDFILSIQTNETDDFISVFDSLYQQNLRISNSGSLMGVGAMSLAVVQGALLSKRNISIKDKFIMCGYESNGYLSNIKTLDNRSTIDESLSALQNANVDNVKENLCGPINMNRITFPFYKMMAFLGYNLTDNKKLNIAALIASQPIVKEFVRLKLIQNSLINKNEYSNYDIIKKCLLSVGFENEDVNDLFNEGINGISFKSNSFIGRSIDFNCSESELIQGLEGIGDKIIALKTFAFFWNVTKEAGKISKYTDLLNITSKGVGNSYFDIIRRIRLLNEMGSDESEGNIINITSLIGDFVFIKEDTNIDEYIKDGYEYIQGCSYLIKPTTNEGIVLIKALKMSENVLSNIFGYKNKTINAIYNKIIDFMEESYIPSDIVDKIASQIPTGIKEYMYKLCGNKNFLKNISKETGTDITGLWESSFKEEEERLIRPVNNGIIFSYNEFNLENDENYIKAMNQFLNDKKEDKIIQYKPGEKVNLGYIITFLKRSGIGDGNKLLEALAVQQNGTLRYTQKTNMLSNDDVIFGFIEMFNNDENIKINGNNVIANGEILTWNNLAKDIAAYSFLCDSENGVLNLREHIPFEYIEETKTDVLLRYLYNNIEKFFVPDLFFEQFITSYPEAIRLIDASNKILSENLFFSNIKGNRLTATSEAIKFSYTLDINTDDERTIRLLGGRFISKRNGIFTLPKYLSFKYTEENGKTGIVIFKQRDYEITTYDRIEAKNKDFGTNTFDPTAQITKYNISQDNEYIPVSLLKETNDKTQVIEQLRDRLDPTDPMTKVINLLLQSIIENEDMFIDLKIINSNEKPKAVFKRQADDGSRHYELLLPANCTNYILKEELMHIAQLQALANNFYFENVNGEYIITREKESKYNIFQSSYNVYKVFKKWYEKNSEKYKQDKIELLSSYGYLYQIDRIANDFAEFIAAGASVHPVFVDIINQFEKESGMSQNNVFLKIINAIKKVFENIINSLFKGQPNTIKVILDDTIKSINAYFLQKNVFGMFKDDTSIIDNEINNLIEQIHNNIYRQNDPDIIDASNIDNINSTTNNVKQEFRGKIIVSPYGMGKTTASDNETVIDMDYIWAEALATYAFDSQLKRENNIIQADIWVKQRGDYGGIEQFNKMREFVINKCNELLDEGKTILASPTILNGNYGNLTERIAKFIAPTDKMKDEVISNLINRKNQFGTKESYTDMIDKQIKMLRELYKKDKSKMVLDKYVSDVIYDNYSAKTSKNNAFIVDIDNNGNRSIIPTKVNEENIVISKQDNEEYPDLCK